MPYAPLGTLYAASHVRNHGHVVAFLDSMLANAEEDIRPLVVKHKPDFLVIYDDDFNYLTKMCLSRMREAAFRMSAIAKEYGTTVIVHGSDAADHVEEYIDHGADYVIFGEGEQTLVELLDSLNSRTGTPLKNVHGIAFRSDNRIERTPPRDLLHDVDALPFPARDLVDVEQYRRAWKTRHGYFSINIVSTRGCPYHCNWCAKPIYGQVYNTRSPENVVTEMLNIKQRYQPDHLWFCDDIFGLKPGWVGDFAEAVRKAGAMIPFKCLSRADLLLKENAIRHLVDAGCRTVWIGAESGSQKILDAMEKGTTIEQIYESTKRMHEAGIKVGFFLQYGYPGETNTDIDLTLKMVKECMPDDIGISVSYPLPGTKFYENVRHSLGEKENWIDSQDLDLMYSGEYVPDFYRALHKLTHKKFRMWQGIQLLKRNALHPWKLNHDEARRIASAAYHRVTLPGVQQSIDKLAKVKSYPAIQPTKS